MSKYSNKHQVVYAAAVWVFGGDDSLSGEERKRIFEAINGERTPWTIKRDDEDEKWVINLFKHGKVILDDIVEAVDNEFDFSLQHKFLLYACVCGPMHTLNKTKSCEDGWGRANKLRSALGIENDMYNEWASSS
jgi:hypothetical protein